ncbi:hypothetical protein [Helicobacter marmotae]|uniref:Uncharacterized protein n=1 Tax=Helicobacter marmotae TaxID=152490 RepID=A0A3D8I7M7_9HELI|nr:hypothetical protein [Helicobacter marmotae]RDU60996.1 hypothetical protein CQA63_00345 [Helicobacter marmotae]
MNWHDKLKVALLNGNDQDAFYLVTHLPQELALSDIEDKLQALELIHQTKLLLESKQQKVKAHMEQIKAAKKFLENTL